jgi:hypothetical protein
MYASKNLISIVAAERRLKVLQRKLKLVQRRPVVDEKTNLKIDMGLKLKIVPDSSLIYNL